MRNIEKTQEEVANITSSIINSIDTNDIALSGLALVNAILMVANFIKSEHSSKLANTFVDELTEILNKREILNNDRRVH